MSKPEFSHLRLHSEYSLSDGTIRIKKLIAQIKESGYQSVAITDVNNIFGLIKFYKAATSANIKPILGAEVLVRSPEGIHKLVLLCQNNTGYRHLCEIISEAYLHGQIDHQVAINIDDLKTRGKGLIALSGAMEGIVGHYLLQNKLDLAKKELQNYQEIFHQQFYIEVQRINKPDEQKYFDRALALAESTQTPALATNHVCFHHEDDFYAHEARVCINRGCLLSDTNRARDYTEQQYFKSPTEMSELFHDYPILLENAERVAQKCNVTLELGKNYLPAFDNDFGLSEKDYLVKAAQEGLEDRLIQLFKTDDQIKAVRKTYDDRLAFEINVINQMGFPGYFLIVADFIQWSKDNDIPVGPGRGSGAGSLVAYSLKITDLDPLAYDLLFERFLNPERVSMPDFDVDFCMDKRDAVIDYVAQKYGRDKVSQIATHGTMAAKAVVRDVGRVLGNGYGFVDSIAKQIPFEIGMTLTKALEVEPELKDRYDNDDEVKTLLDLALSLEGLARNVGKHAGGVVIAPSKLTDFSALYCEQDSQSITVQYDKDDIESAGLVKFDFLGLRTLTIIDWAIKSVNSKRKAQKKDPIHILDIPLDDVKTYELLKNCQTTAVFQLESSGMKDLIKRLQPDRFEDIIALVALFRPGPLQSGMVDDFINVKHGRSQANYPHPKLEQILEPTYGVILYQEQVMQIAQVLASYTLGQADMLRRAMGKKKPEEMAKQRELFVKGSIANEVAEETASNIFDLMEKFAGYGFNKSHSAAYALLAYQTAWLKTHYPEEFMAAVLSADMDNTDKVVTLIEECRNIGVTVKPPSINSSLYKFSTNTDNAIVYGLGAIKGAGESALTTIIDFRQKEGQFTSITDYFTRADFTKVNKRVLEALIKAGAFDEIEPDRAYLFENLEPFLKLAEQTAKNKKTGQKDLFGMLQPADNQQSVITTRNEHWSDQETLQFEKIALGLYLTGHPIDSYKKELHKITGSDIFTVTNNFPNKPTGRREKGQTVWIAGLIINVRIRQGQRGKMAFVTIDDRSARLEVRFFSKAFEQAEYLLKEDQVIIIKGKVTYDDFADAFKVNAENSFDLATVRQECATAVQLSLTDQSPVDKLIQNLKPILTSDANTEVFFDVTTSQSKGKLRLPDTQKINMTHDHYELLQNIIGSEQITMNFNLTKLADSLSE